MSLVKKLVLLPIDPQLLLLQPLINQPSFGHLGMSEHPEGHL